MVRDKESRQKAMEKQASLAPSGSIPEKEAAALELLENSEWEGPFRALQFAERKQA